MRSDIFVSPGQNVLAEFTYENNGPNDELGVAIGVYLSPNNAISSNDQLSRSTWVDLHANSNAYTTQHELTIPDAAPWRVLVGRCDQR